MQLGGRLLPRDSLKPLSQGVMVFSSEKASVKCNKQERCSSQRHSAQNVPQTEHEKLNYRLVCVVTESVHHGKIRATVSDGRKH